MLRNVKVTKEDSGRELLKLHKRRKQIGRQVGANLDISLSKMSGNKMFIQDELQMPPSWLEKEPKGDKDPSLADADGLSKLHQRRSSVIQNLFQWRAQNIKTDATSLKHDHILKAHIKYLQRNQSIDQSKYRKG